MGITKGLTQNRMHLMLGTVDESPYYAVTFSVVLAYFQSTSSFMYALVAGFIFNILAGLRADEVKIRLWRVCNFNGSKFKDSLLELFLIVSITYLLQLIAELMGHNEKGKFIVEVLTWVAVYNYIRNGLRNLNRAYPTNVWLSFVYHFLSFKFHELMPESVKNAWDKANKKSSAPKPTDKDG